MSRLFPDCLVFNPDRLVPTSWKHSTAGRFDKYDWNIFAGKPISNDHRLFHPICETSDITRGIRLVSRTWQLIRWLPSYLKLCYSFKELYSSLYPWVTQGTQLPPTRTVLNWLRQPGLLLKRLSKSMRENFNPLIKSCYTRTVPATETKSIGPPANAQLSWFLHTTLTILSWRDKSCPLIGTTPTGQFHRDTKRSSTYRDFAKTHANPSML
jgi:hypothetical protein